MLDVVVSHVAGKVLHEDVVEHFSLVGSAFGGKLDTDKVLFVTLFLKGKLGVLSILETDEAVAAGSMVLIKRDFCGDDSSELGEVILKVTGFKIPVNLSDKDVLLLELG